MLNEFILRFNMMTYSILVNKHFSSTLLLVLGLGLRQLLAASCMSSEFQYPNRNGGSPQAESLDLSGSEDGDDHMENGGDYSTRMEELFADDVHDLNSHVEDDSDDDEGFLYTGNDADLSTSYRDQLRDVLEGDSDAEIHEVEKSLIEADSAEEIASEGEENDPLSCLTKHIRRQSQPRQG
ncbi:hypothetical protein F5050DRAFT_801211 [Lentinula boryana]|uniref:Uncharacterized protein n=1 Tax=Lentinula boryana TaxID=40481 RepID=A0ABQ8QUG4_9AGAR|nr:hypothetical protein F5050DRAFT_801211 [Lentinula boryana]